MEHSGRFDAIELTQSRNGRVVARGNFGEGIPWPDFIITDLWRAHHNRCLHYLCWMIFVVVRRFGAWPKQALVHKEILVFEAFICKIDDFFGVHGRIVKANFKVQMRTVGVSGIAAKGNRLSCNDVLVWVDQKLTKVGIEGL